MAVIRRLRFVVALSLLPAATVAQDKVPIMTGDLHSVDRAHRIETRLNAEITNADRQSRVAGLLSALESSTRARTDVPIYQILDIGTLGGDETAASDINEAGQVTGASGTGDSYHAFLYTRGEMVDLGTLPGGSASSGSAINESGQVTGSSDTALEVSHAFAYSNGTMLDLGSVGGGNSAGNDINAAGQVTGYSWKPDVGEYFAFLYSNGEMKDLGTLGDSYSTGLAINDAGEVAGYYQRQSDSHAFLYSAGTMSDIVPSGFSFVRSPLGQPLNAAGHVTGSYRPSGDNRAFLFRDGTTINLGTLGGPVSDGFAINDADEVTGYSTTSTGDYHAFLWSQGAMQDLGTLGGDFSLGYAVNNSGQVTGSSTTSSGSQYPFVHARGRMVLLDIGALGGYYGYGIDINNSGQVLGTYFKVVQNEPFEDEMHAFLATPISLLFSQLLAKARGIGPGQSLSNNVRAAQAYYAVPDLQSTCSLLAGFVNEVQAQTGNKIVQQTANELVADAESIERALECLPTPRQLRPPAHMNGKAERALNRLRENEVRVIVRDGQRRLQQYRRPPDGSAYERNWVDVAELPPRAH